MKLSIIMILIKKEMLVYNVYVMFADRILKDVSKDPSNIIISAIQQNKQILQTYI